jgi:hypothetical protein
LPSRLCASKSVPAQQRRPSDRRQRSHARCHRDGWIARWPRAARQSRKGAAQSLPRAAIEQPLVRARPCGNKSHSSTLEHCTAPFLPARLLRDGSPLDRSLECLLLPRRAERCGAVRSRAQCSRRIELALSSSAVHESFLMSGLRWLCHRSRHCLPLRPGRCRAICAHFFVPCLPARSRLGSFPLGPVPA